MRILIAIHSYAPHFNSGAEIFAERISTWLANNNEVRVLTDENIAPFQYKNHIVMTNKTRIAENYEWADCIITHLVTRNQAVELAARFGKPIFHVCHSRDVPQLQQLPDNYIIYNSYHLQQSCQLPFESVVVQPVTWVNDWRISHGEYITLINCTHNKGAETFYNLALNMPWLKFMGVVGGYGPQMRKVLPNIVYKPHTPDMQAIYDNTRVLLVPSIKESWSLVAAEAQACGVPVVCSDLPGLRENLSDSAIYASGTRGFMDGVQEAIGNRDFWSERGLLRGKEKNHILQLELLYNFMKEKVDKKQGKEKVEMSVVKEKKVIDKPVTKIEKVK